MEEQLYQYLSRIRQIDRIIEQPIRGMIGMVWDGKAKKLKEQIKFQRWIAEHGKPQEAEFRTTSCLGMATLQRIWQARRRFAWMRDDDRLSELQARIQSTLGTVGPDAAEEDAGKRFKELVDRLSSNTFGPLNALTAGQVFRVLLQLGEGETHGELGFLAFFAMIWSLERSYPDELARGASLGPWGPTAYVTAKCLLPIARVSSICGLRADYLRELAESTRQLRSTRTELDDYGRWRFAAACDQLSRTMFSLSTLSISPKHVSDSAKKIADIAGEISSQGPWSQKEAQEKWTQVLSVLGGVIQEIGNRSKDIAIRVEEVLGQIKLQILKPLSDAQKQWITSKDIPPESAQDVWPEIAKRVQEEWQQWGEDPSYLKDLFTSGKNALTICRDALSKLKKVATEALKEDFGRQPASWEARSEKIEKILEAMASSYRATQKVIDGAVKVDARWCRSVMERQIAHVSAGSYTEFDAAELVSAIAVAVRWRQINTPLQVKDAVNKALAGAREDGSWSPGRPFYPRDDAVGAWALTTDLVSTLANAIRRHPDVDVADVAFMRYVDWLERTRLTLTRDGVTMTGWASDRAPSHERIDLWATSFAIDALLDIRDLLEHRLWQLCEKRFTIISKVTPLSGIDPVDLGVKHKDRLHRRLYQMARTTQGEEWDKGEYSLVLHGPPGSSKTKVAEAISDEMWTSSLRWGKRGEPRLVRITPADFTRGGEDRIDFEARLIFDLLRHLRGVTIFFDEIDDLLRKRDPGRHPDFIDLIIPGMLNRLQDLRDACPRQEICFLIATNYIEKIEPALIRRGRIDYSIPVTYPDAESRRMMVCRHARALEKALTEAGRVTEPYVGSFRDTGTLCAREARGWPWTALDSLLKNVRAEIFEDVKKGQTTLDVVEMLNRKKQQTENTFSVPEYRTRYRDVLVHPNLRIEFATQLRATTSLPGNGAGAQTFVEAAIESLGGPDWPEGNDRPALTAASREVKEFKEWMTAFVARSASASDGR